MEVATREVSGTRTAGLHVVVSGVASDAHTWNLVFLQLLLEELGHRVTNLGACVPDRTLLAECRNLRPDLLVVSSVNGHGGLDGRRVAQLLREDPVCGPLPMVIGGKLGISGPDGQETGPLLDVGFDAVFEDGAGLSSFRSFLRAVEAGQQAVPASVAP